MVEATGAQAVLAGIRIPPNYGSAYTESLAAVYTELAEAHGVPLLEFMLDGVALNPSLMQADGIHPNAEGQQIILENVWSVLDDVLAHE
jgi:acyl-CoA thioesterase-1